MPSITTLDSSSDSIDVLIHHHRYLTIHVAADPHAASARPLVDDFTARISPVEARYRALDSAALTAAAAAAPLSRQLDQLIFHVSAGIHKGKQPVTTSPVHKIYFDSDTAYDTRRLPFATKVEKLSTWPGLLEKDDDPALKVLAPEAKAIVAASEAAVREMSRSEVAFKAFRVTGDGARLFDAYNALAATTLGTLNAYASDHHELELPTNWGASFFFHPHRGNGKPKTLAEFDDAIATVREAHDTLVKGREELVAAQDDADKAQQEVALAEDDLKNAEAQGKAADQKKKTAKAGLKAAKRKARSAKKTAKPGKRPPAVAPAKPKNS